MDRQHQESKRLPPMVTTLQMGILMCDDMRQLCFIRSGRNVDSRLDSSQDKRCLNIIADPSIISQMQRCFYFALYENIADCRIDKHDTHSEHPAKGRKYRFPLYLFNTCINRYRRYTWKIRVFDWVEHSAFVILWRLHHKNLLRNWLCIRYKAQRTFKRDRAKQTHCYHRPEKHIDPLGSFLQKHTQKDDRKDQPGCGNTHVQDFQK